MKTKQQAKTLK